MTRPTSLSSDNASESTHFTPSTSLSPFPQGSSRSRQASPSPLRASLKAGHAQNEAPPVSRSQKTLDRSHSNEEDKARPSDDLDAYEMHSLSDRPVDGNASEPLLSDNKYGRRSHGSSDRPFLVSRGSHLRSRTPKYPPPEDQARRKYIYAALCLLVALVSFVVQTETSFYIQSKLKWNKAYCMLWLTHGSWCFLWPVQLIFLRFSKRKQSWAAFWRRHKALLNSTAQMVFNQELHLSSSTVKRSPWPYMIKTTCFITTFLTFAGASWYVAINMTSPSDLTAIYNCSAFFAYVFSIVLLKDKVRLDKILSVALAIAGVLIVAYGDTDDPKTPGQSDDSAGPDLVPNNRLVGNLVIGIGSVLYGLYEVLYKKYACPPDGTSPNRGVIFANTFGSMIGTFTLCVLWIPLPILHFTGIERFELPRGQAAFLLAISTLTNATFSGAFLVLMSLTSPVLSSVAALLTIFLVAITDWIWRGKPLSPAALGGGILIIIAFLMLSWATYREMQEEARQRDINDEDKIVSDDDEEDDEPRDDLGKPRNGSIRAGAAGNGDVDDYAEGAMNGLSGKRRRSTIVIRGDESEDDEIGDEDYASGGADTRRH